MESAAEPPPVHEDLGATKLLVLDPYPLRKSEPQ